MARSAYREAVALFERALRVMQHLPDSRDTIAQAIDLRLALRTALRPLGEFERTLVVLREAETLAAALSREDISALERGRGKERGEGRRGRGRGGRGGGEREGGRGGGRGGGEGGREGGGGGGGGLAQPSLRCPRRGPTDSYGTARTAGVTQGDEIPACIARGTVVEMRRQQVVLSRMAILEDIKQLPANWLFYNGSRVPITGLCYDTRHVETMTLPVDTPAWRASR